MAEQFNIPIQVNFTNAGGTAAQAAIHGVEQAAKAAATNVTQTANTLEHAAAGPIQNFSRGAKDAGVNTGKFGALATQASYQITDFTTQVSMGTSAITAFAMQAPQLLGSLGAAGVVSSGAALGLSLFSAALPIALFGGMALFKWLDKGEEKTKSIKKQFEDMRSIKGVFEELEQDAETARKDSLTAQGEALKSALGGVDLKYGIAQAALGLQSARENSAEQVRLSQQRLEVARLESAVANASGETLLRLAREREAAVMRVFDTELRISELARTQAEGKAELDVEKAGAKVDALKTSDVPLVAQYNELKGVITGLTSQADTLQAQKLAVIDEIDAEITLKRKRLARIEELLPTVTDQGTYQRLKEESSGIGIELGDLGKKRAAEFADNSDIASLIAEAQAKQPQLDLLKGELEKSATAQSEAATAMSEATRALRDLREKQGLERTGEATQRKAAVVGGSDTTNAIKRAIEAIKGNISTTGEKIPPKGGFAGMETPKSEALNKLGALLTDATPDADQTQALADILMSLKTGLGAKDTILIGGLESLISLATTQASQYKDAIDRITTLENQAKQKR